MQSRLLRRILLIVGLLVVTAVVDVTRFEQCAGRPVEPWEAGLVETLRHLRDLREEQRDLRKGRRRG